jgi:hypothetical protein
MKICYLCFTLALLGAMVPSVASAQTYSDTFTSNPGPLNGRTTAAGFGNWTNPDGTLSASATLHLTESLAATTTTGSFALPTLVSGDIITESLTLEPSGGANNRIEFGFTPEANEFVTTEGNAAVWLFGADSGPDGTVGVFSGPSTEGQLYYANPFSAFSGTSPTQINISYNTATGLFDVTGTNNGQTVTIVDQDVNYGGTSGAVIPLSQLKFATVQFDGQTTGVDSISNLSITIVPEPSGVLYLAVGLGALGLGLFRRNRIAV